MCTVSNCCLCAKNRSNLPVLDDGILVKDKGSGRWGLRHGEPSLLLLIIAFVKGETLFNSKSTGIIGLAGPRTTARLCAGTLGLQQRRTSNPGHIVKRVERVRSGFVGPCPRGCSNVQLPTRTTLATKSREDLHGQSPISAPPVGLGAERLCWQPRNTGPEARQFP